MKRFRPWSPQGSGPQVERPDLSTGIERLVDSPPRILLAEDAEDTRELYGFHLSRSGFDVLTAEDGPTAFSVARISMPDVVVLDVGLPRVSGLSVTRRLRADPDLCRIPIVLLSATVGDLEDEAKLAGADRWLRKPCLPEKLEEVLNELLALHGERLEEPG